MLEHLSEPGDCVSRVADAVAPGGVVVVETWALDNWMARVFRSKWQQANPPSVLHLFTRPGIRSLLVRAGLRVESVHVYPKRVSVGAVASVAAGRGCPGSESLSPWTIWCSWSPGDRNRRGAMCSQTFVKAWPAHEVGTWWISAMCAARIGPLV